MSVEDPYANKKKAEETRLHNRPPDTAEEHGQKRDSSELKKEQPDDRRVGRPKVTTDS